MNEASKYFLWLLANVDVRDLKVTPVYEEVSIGGQKLPRLVSYNVEMAGNLPAFPKED